MKLDILIILCILISLNSYSTTGDIFRTETVEIGQNWIYISRGIEYNETAVRQSIWRDTSSAAVDTTRPFTSISNFKLEEDNMTIIVSLAETEGNLLISRRGGVPHSFQRDLHGIIHIQFIDLVNETVFINSPIDDWPWTSPLGNSFDSPFPTSTYSSKIVIIQSGYNIEFNISYTLTMNSSYFKAEFAAFNIRMRSFDNSTSFEDLLYLPLQDGWSINIDGSRYISSQKYQSNDRFTFVHNTLAYELFYEDSEIALPTRIVQKEPINRTISEVELINLTQDEIVEKVEYNLIQEVVMPNGSEKTPFMFNLFIVGLIVIAVARRRIGRSSNRFYLTL